MFATDTERVFCTLLERIAARGWRSLDDADLKIVHAWLTELNALGSLDLVLCDGRDLLAYADRFGPETLHLGELLPPYAKLVIGDDDVQIDSTSRGKSERKGIIVSSSALKSEGSAHRLSWRRLRAGELVVVRQGAIVGNVAAQEPAGDEQKPVDALHSRAHRRQAAMAAPMRLSIVHRTVYSYAHPVERSTH